LSSTVAPWIFLAGPALCHGPVAESKAVRQLARPPFLPHEPCSRTAEPDKLSA
jgi:hypothetical protein